MGVTSVGRGFLTSLIFPVGSVFWSIAFWIMVVVIVHAGIVSWQEQSLEPLLIEPASYLVSADAQLLSVARDWQGSSFVLDDSNFFTLVISFFGKVFEWIEVFSLMFFVVVNFALWIKFSEWINPNGNMIGYFTHAFIYIVLLENVWSLYVLGTFSFPLLGVFTFLLTLAGASQPVFDFLHANLATKHIPLITDIPAPANNSTVIS